MHPVETAAFAWSLKKANSLQTCTQPNSLAMSSYKVKAT